MRKIAFAAAATAFALGASSTLAAPASVAVAVGPDLQAKAAKTYGVKEIDRLADMLRQDVERSLARTGAYDGARIELTLVDATPNRPTFKQLTDQPGLSFASFGVGGATIEGRAVAPDGTVTPLRYRWYEGDIRRAAHGTWTWADADWAFNRFAYRLGRGEVVASR